KILDYGCANGFFLDYCVSIGCSKEDLFGFDIAEDLLEDLCKNNYNILSNQKNFFDYIFLWDVLEHITDPKEFLENIKSYLKIGSKLIIQTPRVGILSDSLKDKWEHFLPFEHVILYTRDSLIKQLKTADFKLSKAMSFGANAPINIIPYPYKNAFDKIAKQTDNGSTQVVCFTLINK
ncbi:MAG: class I SAM-dependent methyltransferase, partial [Candidatus Subteraquimicrobiales bacterium]|nr:class I SAM-dependent methyltransferase [Candidatus Subteraquimicrobiales bacterium]